MALLELEIKMSKVIESTIRRVMFLISFPSQNVTKLVRLSSQSDFKHNPKMSCNFPLIAETVQYVCQFDIALVHLLLEKFSTYSDLAFVMSLTGILF